MQQFDASPISRSDPPVITSLLALPSPSSVSINPRNDRNIYFSAARGHTPSLREAPPTALPHPHSFTHSLFLTRPFIVCLCRATCWNNKPGEVSFICRTNVDTACSLSLCGFYCSIALSFLIHSLSVSVVLRLLLLLFSLHRGLMVLYEG